MRQRRRDEYMDQGSGLETTSDGICTNRDTPDNKGVKYMAKYAATTQQLPRER